MRKEILKRSAARWAPRAAAEALRVLLYHAVDEPHPDDRLGLRVAPEAFRSHLECLREEGYRVVPLNEALTMKEKAQPRCVAITFDDGYDSQREAAKMLGAFGFPATFFLIASFLEGRRGGGGYWDRWPMMGWSDALELARQGFEIGAHSFSHVRLTACTSFELEREIAGAKRKLEDRLGRTVSSFSYPHGAYNATVLAAVARAGFRLACTSIYGANRARQSRFELRRIEVTGSDRLEDFRRKLHGQYDWLGLWQQWGRRHA